MVTYLDRDGWFYGNTALETIRNSSLFDIFTGEKTLIIITKIV